MGYTEIYEIVERNIPGSNVGYVPIVMASTRKDNMLIEKCS